MRTIGLAADHAGFELKEFAKRWLKTKGYAIKDFGTHSTESCDYSDYGHALAFSVESGECAFGIAVCGSGEGIGMTVNKHQGIRAALCWKPEIARLARQHNNANILVLPGRFISQEETVPVLEAFFDSEFEGGRHLRRIKKIPLFPRP